MNDMLHMDTLTAPNAIPHREMKILEDALAALTKTTGLRAKVVARELKTPADRYVDAVIELEEQGRRFTFLAEIKKVDRAAALGAVKEQITPYDGKGLLVAPYLTPELANHCRKIELPFIDTAGNAYLQATGLFVFVKGEKRPEHLTMMGTGGGGTATALRMVFALLCRPDLLNAPYREIVNAAGVALGAVGWVFFDLEGRGHVAGGKRKRNRRLLEPKRLFEEWVTNYPIKLRPKLNPRRFRAPNAEWWKAAQLPKGAYWGGEVAADRLTNFLKPATFTVYMDTEPEQGRENIAALVGPHRLRADPTGDVEVLDKFWNFDRDATQPDLVPPILIYADLVATQDTRNLEVARLIRERFIENVFRQT
jgi:hypothetical protein